MGAFQKLENLVLPQEIDFFKLLQEQSTLAKVIIEELHHIYITQTSPDSKKLQSLIEDAEQSRLKNLKLLYQVFITPVDKEALGRAFINLDWVVMSIKHLEVELSIYELKALLEYKAIFDLLKEEIEDIYTGFKLLHDKSVDHSSQNVFNVIRCDNELIKEYARQVSLLLDSNDIKKIITRKEILNQLKEVSKRIRMCANDLEDMLFKMT